MSDVAAGAAYGLWGTLSTLYGFLLGPAIDSLGVRRALILSFTLSAASKLALALAHSRGAALFVLYGPLPAAGALGIPVMTIAVRRATHDANRGAAYGLFYSLMNVAALAAGACCVRVLTWRDTRWEAVLMSDVCALCFANAGLCVDAFRLGLRDGLRLPRRGPHSALNNGQRLLVLLGAATSVAGAAIAATMRDVRVPSTPPPPCLDEEEDDDSVFDDDAALWPVPPMAPLPPLPPAAPLPRTHSGGSGGGGGSVRPMRVSAAPPPPPLPRASPASSLAAARALLRDRRFWQYSAMCVLMVNLKGIFRHVDATLPKYLIRAFGCGAPIGTIYSINPFMIIFLVPLVAAATTTCEHFAMITRGAWVSALAPLWLAAAQRYWAAVAFVVTLSVGEAVWSPRWYDLTMAMAPEGKEGIFTALSSAPLFVAQLPTGMLSGALLSRFCPAAAEAACEPGGAPPPPPGGASAPPATCDGKAMWGIITIVTLASPLLITAFAPWIRPAPPAAAGANGEGEGALGSPASGGSGSVGGRRRVDALADALTGGFGGIRASLSAAVASSRASLRASGLAGGAAASGTGGDGVADDDEDSRLSDAGSDAADDFRAPDGGLHTPLLLRSYGAG
jgi:hypothetical protein